MIRKAIKNLAAATAEVAKMYLGEIDEAINPVSEISAPILIGSMEAICSSLKDSYPDAAKEAKNNKIGEAIKKGITSTIKVDITNIFKDVNDG